MNKYVEFITKHRKALLILLVVTNILAIVGIFQIRISTDFNIFVPTESEYKDSMDEMNELFESSESLVIMTETAEDDKNFFTDARHLQDYLEGLEGVVEAKGPGPEEISVGDFTLKIDNLTEIQEELLLEYYNKLGDLSPVIFKDNKLYGIYEVFVTDDFNSNKIKDIEEYLNEEEYTYYMSGDLYMQRKMFEYILRILLIIPPAAFFLVLFVFNTQIKSLKGTILSVMPAGIGALWTLGTLGWLGMEVSIITILAPIFTIVIGSADGLHFISHVQDARKEGKDKKASIAQTLKMVGIPMIVTTVTSIAGFVALLAMKTDAIKDLALFVSLGIMFAGIATWYVLPVILSGNVNINTKKANAHKEAVGIKKLWGMTSIIIAVVLLLVSAYGMSSIKTEFNMLMIYKETTDVNESFTKLNEINDGSVPVFLMITTEKNPLTKDNAEKIMALQNEIKDLDDVGKTLSVYDMYATIFKIFTGSENALFLENEMITNRITSYLTDSTKSLFNQDENIIRMLVFPAGFENEKLDSITKVVNQFKTDNPDMKINLTGSSYLMRDLNNGMVENQFKSIALAFALIFILLLISLRKIIPTLITIIPIGITVVVLYGFLGFTGISLNVITSTIFCITLGVGIDYAVHYTSIFMEFKKQGLTSEESVNKAYQYTSRPIMSNAFGIVIGMSALLLSPLQIHTNVALLMWVSMICGVFLSLSFLPTLLRRYKG